MKERRNLPPAVILSEAKNPYPRLYVNDMEKHFFVYILSNKTDVATYIGVTSNLPARVYEHKNHMDPNSFTAKYNITKLVYYEEAGTDPLVAFEREKQLKGWTRAKKNALINSMNPTWSDLYETLF